MPGTFDNFDEDFDTTIDTTIDNVLQELEEGVNEYLKYRTGFFTPYRSVGDFGYTLVSPVVEPIIDSIAFAAASAVSLSAVAASAFFIGVAGISALGGSEDGIVIGLALSALSILTAAISAAVALVALLAAVISIPANCISIVTRSLATVADAICDGQSQDYDSESESHYDYGSAY
jgi:hypothetical protein